MPMVSVIAPTFNRCEVVEQTIEHLRAQEYPDDRYEILIVDNSVDDTPDMVRAQSARPGPRVRLIADCDPLPARKRNLGAQLAEGDLHWFINDDVWFAPDAMAQHVMTHQQHQRPVAVLGSCRQSAQMPYTPFVEFYEPFAYELMEPFVDRAVPWHFVWSMNLTVPAATVRDRNLWFHEDWRHIGHEDVEFGFRWIEAGYDAIFNPRARGEHYHPHTVRSACRLQESVGRGLRDLEQLVDDPGLLERYGVLHRSSSTRGVARGLARSAVVNRWTREPLVRWLDGRQVRSRTAEWLYWKVLIAHTNIGYRQETPRSVIATPTFPADGEVAA